MKTGRRKNSLWSRLTGKKPARKAPRETDVERLQRAGVDLQAIAEGKRRSKEESLYRRRKNSEGDAAASISESFHGRPVRKVREVLETYHEVTDLADLGRLVELQVLDGSGKHVTPLEFRGNIRVACSPDGGQLYFVGGNQQLDLAGLHLDRYLPKDHIELGPCAAIAYHTSKAFHAFEPSVYEHQFGEDNGELPTLAYDVRSSKLYLIGGSYQVRPEGIVN